VQRIADEKSYIEARHELQAGAHSCEVSDVIAIASNERGRRRQRWLCLRRTGHVRAVLHRLSWARRSWTQSTWPSPIVVGGGWLFVLYRDGRAPDCSDLVGGFGVLGSLVAVEVSELPLCPGGGIVASLCPVQVVALPATPRGPVQPAPGRGADGRGCRGCPRPRSCRRRADVLGDISVETAKTTCSATNSLPGVN
jgi:hypothetical protein